MIETTPKPPVAQRAGGILKCAIDDLEVAPTKVSDAIRMISRLRSRGGKDFPAAAEALTSDAWPGAHAVYLLAKEVSAKGMSDETANEDFASAVEQLDAATGDMFEAGPNSPEFLLRGNGGNEHDAQSTCIMLDKVVRQQMLIRDAVAKFSPIFKEQRSSDVIEQVEATIQVLQLAAYKTQTDFANYTAPTLDKFNQCFNKRTTPAGEAATTNPVAPGPAKQGENDDEHGDGHPVVSTEGTDPVPLEDLEITEEHKLTMLTLHDMAQKAYNGLREELQCLRRNADIMTTLTVERFPQLLGRFWSDDYDPSNLSKNVMNAAEQTCKDITHVCSYIESAKVLMSSPPMDPVDYVRNNTGRSDSKQTHRASIRIFAEMHTGFENWEFAPMENYSRGEFVEPLVSFSAAIESFRTHAGDVLYQKHVVALVESATKNVVQHIVDIRPVSAAAMQQLALNRVVPTVISGSLTDLVNESFAFGQNLTASDLLGSLSHCKVADFSRSSHQSFR